jgi:ubiquinone biosynthesis monooxygenase Coq7
MAAKSKSPINAGIARMIRVDQAGEYGAARIYAGQLAVLGKSPAAPVLRHMAEKESEHLDDFNRVLVERQVRPTALQPIWHVAGYALGAATALMGTKVAMACTEAVEDVIVDHYKRQEASLNEQAALGHNDPELAALISKARADESGHRETALQEGALKAPAHGPLTATIRAGTRLAIWLSERV